MAAEGKSGLYYPNRFARILCLALEEVSGKSGVASFLNTAGLNHYIDNYPPDDMERQVDFADLAALVRALIEGYGPRGGRGIALRVGHAAFRLGFQQLLEADESSPPDLPFQARLDAGLRRLAAFFSQHSDQEMEVQEVTQHFIMTLKSCPFCWETQTDQPLCQVMQGLVQEYLNALSDGGDFSVEIMTCRARGSDKGSLSIYKQPIQQMGS